MFGGNFNNFRICRYGGAAKVSENHIAVAGVNFLPFALGNVEVCLLKVELRNGSHGSTKTTTANDLGHLLDHILVEMQGAGISHHHGVCGECAARHWREGYCRRNHFCFRRKEVLLHRLFKGF